MQVLCVVSLIFVAKISFTEPAIMVAGGSFTVVFSYYVLTCVTACLFRTRAQQLKVTMGSCY